MKTYIFDLYGTLIDIHTELHNHKVWKALSDMYACYGAIYTPEQFEQAYLKFNEEEWKRVEELHPDTYIDIQFKNVFKRLYDEAPIHKKVLPIQDIETWLLFVESEFRRLTRIRCKPYRNTIKTLQGLFPNLTFEKADGEIDHTYAVDFQVYKQGKLICAIQVKPKSYTLNAPYIVKARHANANKYAAYKEKYGVPVLTVISTIKGEILNKEIIPQIKSL